MKNIQRHKFQDGGDLSQDYSYNPSNNISGPILGSDQGRDDTVSGNVEDGSHIIPSDVVSSAGDGNTIAGMKKLSSVFPNSNKTPMIPSLGLSNDKPAITPGGIHSHRIGSGMHSIGPHMPKILHMPGFMNKPTGIKHIGHIGHLKTGGKQDSDSVPVKLSHGEFAIHPIDVAKVGDGDIEKGHKILNHMIIVIRAMDIQRRKKLPKPA